MTKKVILYLLVMLLSGILFDNVYATNKYYDIEDYNISFSISSNYNVIIKDNDNSSVYNKLRINKKDIENYMNTLNAYVLATTQDLTKNIIFTRKNDEGSEKYYNLSETDEEVVKSLAKGYVQGTDSQGFNLNDYSIEKINDITYIIFKYDYVSAKNEHIYCLKYKTIYNGYDYTIYIQKYSSISNKDEKELKDTINSIEIEEIENPNKDSDEYVLLSWIVIFLIIAVIVWRTSKQKNKNKDIINKNREKNNLAKKSKKQDSQKVIKKEDEAKTKEDKNKDAVDYREKSKEEKDKPKEEQELKEERKGQQEENDDDIEQKYNDLNKLKELLDRKIITKEEFEIEKKKILK